MNAISLPHSRRMLAGALALGIAANFLVPEGAAWRLGLALWMLLALAVAVSIAGRDRLAHPGTRGAGVRVGGELLVLGVALLLAAMSFVLRDAGALYALGFVGSILTAALLAWRARAETHRLSRFRVVDLALVPVQAATSAALGAPLLAGQGMRSGSAAEDTDALGGVSRRTLLVAGIVLALPVLFVFGALLVASDPVFEAVAMRWVALPFEEALERAALIGFFTWVSAGWLRSFRRPVSIPLPTPDIDALRPRAAFALLAPVMYGVIVLLAVFLVVQARALFGGAAYVELTSGLTYAQYAREGFFGLVVVATLVLALLVLGQWFVAVSEARDVRQFHLAGWTLVALVLVMLASSAQRLLLYISFFGLTDARLYAAAFTTAVAAALGWAGLTILRGRRDLFAAGLLAVAASTVLLLHVINPERVVVQVNAARAAVGEGFDVEYHASLSADALTALGAAAGVLPPEQCAALVTAMHDVWTKRLAGASEAGLGAWSLPRARAADWLAVPLEQRLAASCRA
jgi:hypothetical protein